MKIYLFCLMVLVPYSAVAQVVIKPREPVRVQRKEVADVQITMLNPVPSKIFSDSLIQVEGMVKNGRPGMVLLRLGTVEMLVPMDADGRFSAAVALHQMGENRLEIEADGKSQVVEILYRPIPDALEISPLPTGVLEVGETVQLQVLAHFQNGTISSLSPETVQWKSHNEAIGRVTADGRLVALSPGQTEIYATAEHATAVMPLQVVLPPPPAPSHGLTNMVVHTSRLTLKVWDNAQEDGDIVSIYLNGTPVVEYIELFNQPHRFDLILEPGNNRIEIRAENTGQRPPNTAAISVEPEGERGVVQIFKAPQKTSGRFTITFRKRESQ